MPIEKASFPREHTGDPKIDRIQAELVRLRGILARCPFIDGSLVEDVPVTTSPTTVAHKLGREPKGVILVSGSSSFAGAVIFGPTQPSDPTRLASVVASSSLTASLWFW